MKQKTAANVMITLLLLVLLFHTLILIGCIDYTNVWGGRLKSRDEMYVFEIISIVLNSFLLFTILQKANYIRQILSLQIVHFTLWIFVFIFGLNTIGNLFANNLYEKIIGTLLTMVSAYFCWVIVRKK